MIIEQIKDILKLVEPELATIISFWESAHSESEFQRLTSLTEQETFWQHPDRTAILQSLQHLKVEREQYISLRETNTELHGLASLFADDEQNLQSILQDTIAHQRAIHRFKLSLLLHEDQDASNCFLSINAGAGGTESQDWAEMLLRMYVRFAERERLRADIVDYQAGEAAGIKSATLFVQGKHAYGLLKGEQGVHRLVRISPYDANKRRHTSFAAVLVIPETPLIETSINPNDLRIDTYRAGGAGGQHVNKTESAVRITHLPTNTVVQCQNERSQRQNKETAMKMLAARLKQAEDDRAREKHAAIERKKIEWGSQIRSYVLHPYKMVKDHRTDLESPQPELVLDGELMSFIETFLVQRPDKS